MQPGCGPSSMRLAACHTPLVGFSLVFSSRVRRQNGVWFVNLRDTDVQETHRFAKFALSRSTQLLSCWAPRRTSPTFYPVLCLTGTGRKCTCACVLVHKALGLYEDAPSMLPDRSREQAVPALQGRNWRMRMVPGKLNPGQSWRPHIVFRKVLAFLELRGAGAGYSKGHLALPWGPAPQFPP